jgi:hypothetical protein
MITQIAQILTRITQIKEYEIFNFNFSLLTL